MTNPTSQPTGTLVINRFDSKCGNCGKGALPSQVTHDHIVGMHRGREEGCHVVFTHVTSDYIGPGVEGMCKTVRPDLEWIQQPEFPRPPDRYA